MSDRPTPLVLERPAELGVPNEPRRPDGTLIGFDPPEPPGDERPTARPPALPADELALEEDDGERPSRERTRTPDGTLLGFDGPAGPKLPKP